MKQTLQDLSLIELDIIAKRVNNIVSNSQSWLNDLKSPKHVFQPFPSDEEVKKVRDNLALYEPRLKLVHAEIHSRMEALFSAPSTDEPADMREKILWEKLLGFIPEKVGETHTSGCFNCNSRNVTHLPHPAWTGKFRCNDCGYYTWKIYQDPMGTVAPDDAAADKRDGTITYS